MPLCVCQSFVPGIVSKRLNLGSREQRHTITSGLEFSAAKDLREYISEIVQDKDIITMKD